MIQALNSPNLNHVAEGGGGLSGEILRLSAWLRDGRKCLKRYYMGLKDSFLLRDLDKTLAIAGVILSLILIVYLGREIGRVIYLLTGVLALIACLMWLAIRKSHTFEFHLPKSRTLTTSCAICFFGLYTLSVLSVYLRPELYERPLLYFILTALMAGIIACEIFASGRRHAGLILSQILLLGVSIAWSQLLIFPSLLGVDPWYHSALTSRIIDEGFIPEGYSYTKLPLFHLMIAATSLVAGLPYKFAAMASVSLGQIICNAVFVFLIANYLFKNHQIGLLAALMVIIANHHIYMSYWSIPNAFAAAFILIALYLLFFRFRDRSRSSSAILCMVVLVTVILAHTVTAMCMAILLFIAWGALAVYRACHPRADNHVSLIGPIGFTVIMFAWWTHASGHVRTLGYFIKWGFSVDAIDKTPTKFVSYLESVPLGEQLFNNLAMLLLFAFSFIGIFYMLSRKESSSSFAMAWVGITPLAIGFFSLITGHSVIEHRWWYFAQILMSIPLAVAIYTVGTWKTRNLKLLCCCVFGLVALLSFLMIMSPVANIDNAMFSPNTNWRATPIASELQARTILDHYDGISKSDIYYASRLSYFGYSTEPFCKEIADRDLASLAGDLVLVRDAIITDPFMLFSATYKLDYNLNDIIAATDFRRIYDSGSVCAYL